MNCTSECFSSRQPTRLPSEIVIIPDDRVDQFYANRTFGLLAIILILAGMMMAMMNGKERVTINGKPYHPNDPYVVRLMAKGFGVICTLVFIGMTAVNELYILKKT